MALKADVDCKFCTNEANCGGAGGAHAGTFVQLVTTMSLEE